MQRLRYVWTGVAGTPWYTNLYFNGVDTVDAQAAASAVDTFLKGFSFQFSNQVHVNVESFVPTIDPATGEVTGGVTIIPPSQITGQESGNLLPRQAQALSVLNTPVYLGGRRIKGRIFLPGYTESANDNNGNFSATYQTAIQDEWETLLATGPDLVVWSRKNGIAAPVSDVVVADKWATMNSRRD